MGINATCDECGEDVDFDNCFCDECYQKLLDEVEELKKRIVELESGV